MSIALEAAIRGGEYIWGAPTFDQVRIGFNETRRAAGGVADFNQSRMDVTLPSGGIIHYRSLDDPDNARGYTADGVIIDECGDVKPEAWYEVLRPMLIDTGGWSWMIGTPKGKNHFFQEWTIALDREDSMAWQVPTHGVEIGVDRELTREPHPLENPDIPFSEMVNLWHTMPERTFRQEILAEFIEGEGAVFRNIAAAMHAPMQQTPQMHAGHQMHIGVDWAKLADYTAISVGCKQCKCEVARDRFNKIDYAFQVERLRTLIDEWIPREVLAEQNSIGEPILEQLQRMGLRVTGFQTTASSKPPLIENLALTIERTEWQLQRDVIWTAELEAYERTVSAATGRSSYSAPEGLHDDTVIARALMVWSADGRGRKQAWVA